jgi:predicted membrane channel-forming protein YqfA (hemolysin III family)
MNHQDNDALFHLVGWVLFLVCAFLFLYVAIRDGDVVLALASLVFLVGCIAFLIPLLRHMLRQNTKGEDLPREDEPSRFDEK